jgi:hypothetical protein
VVLQPTFPLPCSFREKPQSFSVSKRACSHYFSDLVHCHVLSQSSHASLLVVPCVLHQASSHPRPFALAAPNAWNALPLDFHMTYSHCFAALNTKMQVRSAFSVRSILTTSHTSFSPGTLILCTCLYFFFSIVICDLLTYYITLFVMFIIFCLPSQLHVPIPYTSFPRLRNLCLFCPLI